MSSNQSFQRLTALSMFPQRTRDDPFSLADISFLLGRRWRILLLAPLITVSLTAVYIMTASPSFVASTQLLISPHVANGETSLALAEDTFIEGEIEIARSSDVLSATASRLSLTSDPQFTETASLRERIKSALSSLVTTPEHSGTAQSPSGDALLEVVIDKLRNVTWVRRIGRSMIVEISASADTPQRAAEIADTLARSYISKNIEMKSRAAKQYSDWLQQLVNEQQNGLTKAANELAAFRANPKDQYRLAELESQAQARRALFESTLTSFTEARQRISSPVSDATIVSPATPPQSKSSPRSALLLAFSLLTGAGMGLIWAIIRHSADRRISGRTQVAELAGTPKLASIKTFSAHQEAGRKPPADPAGKGAPIRRLPEMQALSPLLFNLRRKRKTAIGVTGVNEGVGASTIARELALQSASAGARTLLVDTIGGEGSLSRLLNHDSAKGLCKALSGEASLEQFTVELAPNLYFLPCGARGSVAPALCLGARTSELTVADMKNGFEIVIFDLASGEVTTDAAAIGPELDTMLLVAAQGRTTIDQLSKVASDLRQVGTDLAGTILNKTSGA